MISQDFINKYSAQKAGNEGALGFFSQVDDFAAATIVDVGTSLFNSVVSLPKVFGINTDEYRADTYDVLRRVNEDWAEYYAENKDVVETASFFAGALLPTGLALKGIKALQAGKIGFYPSILSDTTQAARISELQRLLEYGKKSTPEYRNLRWKILGANAGQETLQMAGAELAVVAGLNQHAWIEDYLKDPVGNFAIALTVGGVIGTGMGQLATRKLLRDKLGATSTASLDSVISKLVDIPLGISDVDKVQRYTVNSQILRDIASNDANTPLTRQIAEDFALKWEGRAASLEQNTVFGPLLQASKDTEAKKQARAILMDDAAFGANRIDFLKLEAKDFVKAKGVSGELKTKDAREAANEIYGEPELAPGMTRLYRAEGPKFIKGGGEISFGIPRGAWFVKDKTDLHTSVPSGSSSIATRYLDVPTEAVEGYHARHNKVLKKELDKLYGLDFQFSASGIDEFIVPESLLAQTKMLHIGKGSIDRQNLWAAGNAVRNSLTTTEGLKKFRPEWAKLMEEEFKTYYSPFHKVWIPSSEINNYARAVDSGVTSWETVNVFKPDPDSFAEFAVRGVPTVNADKYWLNTLGTVAAAKPEGAITIMKGDLGRQNAWLSRMEGLQADGKLLPKVFLIPEDAASLTVTEMRKRGVMTDLEGLKANLMEQKETYIKSLLNEGTSLQEISIRLNVPTQTVEKFLMNGGRLGDAGDWRLYHNAGEIETNYLAQSGRTLSFTTNGSRLASISFRNADRSAILDSASIKYQNKEHMANILAESQGTYAKRFYETLNKDDKEWEIFHSQLANIVNEKAGSFFFSSADFASRAMGDIGRIASTKGQELFGVANSVSKEALTNLSAKVRGATATQAGLNEFNEVINILQGIQGFRDIDANTGTLFRLASPEMGVEMREVIRHPDNTELVISPALREVLVELKSVSSEMWHFKNSINKIQGFKELSDIGLWIPSFNPMNKFISYVIDTQGNASGESKVKLLIGKTPEELGGLEANWKTKNGGSDRYKLITKAQQEDYNFWQMRQDPMEMDFADISKFHSGASQSAARVVDDSFATTIIENMHNRILIYGRKMQQLYLDDIMSTLDDMSAMNQKYFAGQPTQTKSIGLAQREDAARSIKNILLGNSNLEQHHTWKSINNGFSSMIEWASAKTQGLYTGIFGADDKLRQLKGDEYIKYSKELESMGVKNPFQGFNDYLTIDKDTPLLKASAGRVMEDLRVDAASRRLNVSHSSAEQIIAAGNSALATLALRVLESGHAIVTAMSWPIITMPEFYRKFPKTYMGNALGEGVEVPFPAKAIYDGIRFRHSDAGKPLIDRWIAEGYGASIVSEATELNRLITVGGKNAAGKIQEIIDSGLVKKLSTLSDVAEKESRLWVLATGYQLSRRMYPGISDKGSDLFAKEFMTRTIGNYYSGQRPVMFQGTLGVALGLFQTYMLTWAQQAFRSIEERQFKALGSQMLAQAGLFGMSSEPLYDLFSKTIGEHFSDKHYDLTTGTYRALPDSMAEFVVYGLPASMGVGLYTRGDMQPRIPFVSTNPLDTIAAVNASRQLYGAMGHTIKKAYEANGMADSMRGLLEGIAMQSLSRPLARIVEAVPVPDGQGGFKAVGSISREGNTISTSAEIWTGPGLVSRLLASRATEEQVKREVDYLNSFYGSVDHANRKGATETLKTAIRGGNLSDGKLEEVAGRYLRTGSATGWKAALNEALATSEGGIDYKLGKRLRPDSPLMRMIDENY